MGSQDSEPLVLNVCNLVCITLGKQGLRCLHFSDEGLLIDFIHQTEPAPSKRVASMNHSAGTGARPPGDFHAPPSGLR